MALVIGIHGIGHTYLTAPQLETEWFDSLQGGLEEARRPSLRRDLFRMVSYGAVYRQEGTRAGDAPFRADDVKEEWDKSMLELWLAESARLAALNRTKGTSDPLGEEPTVQPPDFEGRARTPTVVQNALKQLSKSRFFGALGPERFLVFGLSQVRLYLHDPDIREAVQRRAAAIVTSDTKVLIGHSLGSIVAYELVCAHPEWNLDTLITLGSPLGIRKLVFDLLKPRPPSEKGTRPPVRQWINIVDEGDIVALEKKLDPLFGDVDDRIIYNGWKSHDVRRYLTAKVTGEAIASGLA